MGMNPIKNLFFFPKWWTCLGRIQLELLTPIRQPEQFLTLNILVKNCFPKTINKLVQAMFKILDFCSKSHFQAKITIFRKEILHQNIQC